MAHVVAGRIVWSDYNPPLSQPISDLTAATAISRNAAGKMLYGYDLFNLLFCAVLLFFLRQKSSDQQNVLHWADHQSRC